MICDVSLVYSDKFRKLYKLKRFTGSHGILFNKKYSNIFSSSLQFDTDNTVENVLCDALLDNNLSAYIITPFAVDFERKQYSAVRQQYVEDMITFDVESYLLQNKIVN